MKFRTQPFISISFLTTTGGDSLPIMNQRNNSLAINKIIAQKSGLSTSSSITFGVFGIFVWFRGVSPFAFHAVTVISYFL